VRSGVWDPGEHDPAPGPRGPQREVERRARAHAVDRDVDAAHQEARAHLRLELHRARRAPDRVHRLARRDDLVGAERLGPATLQPVLRDHRDPAGPREPLERKQREHADRPRADHEHVGVRPHLGPERRVDRARERLDEHRAPVRELLGHRVELGAVRDEHAAPSAAGLAAVAGLEPGLDVPGRDPVAPAREACSAVVARLQVSRLAPQDGLEHDACAGGKVLDVVEELADDLVPGDERHRDER
jgi:hypothetical protein